MSKKTNDEVIVDLLWHVQKYYPIGMPEYYSQPRIIPLERDIIVAEKIESVIKDLEMPWKKFAGILQREGKELVMMTHRQFPSYALSIKIPDQNYSTAAVEHHRELVVIVSMLCPYYTVYYLDSYRFNNIRSVEIPFGPIFRVAFTRLLPELTFNQDQLYSEVRVKIEEHFPSCVYVDHGKLLSRYVHSSLKLEGQPSEGPYPIYSYLFDDSFSMANLEIRM